MGTPSPFPTEPEHWRDDRWRQSTFYKWLCEEPVRSGLVINVDGHASYPAAVTELKKSGELGHRCHVRPCQYLNNVLEQDHRFVKKRIPASLWFRSVDGPLRTIQGYESMNMIRKGQVSWVAKSDIVGQVRFIERVSGSLHRTDQRRIGLSSPSKAICDRSASFATPHRAPWRRSKQACPSTGAAEHAGQEISDEDARRQKHER